MSKYLSLIALVLLLLIPMPLAAQSDGNSVPLVYFGVDTNLYLTTTMGGEPLLLSSRIDSGHGPQSPILWPDASQVVYIETLGGDAHLMSYLIETGETSILVENDVWSSFPPAFDESGDYIYYTGEPVTTVQSTSIGTLYRISHTGGIPELIKDDLAFGFACGGYRGTPTPFQRLYDQTAAGALGGRALGGNTVILNWTTVGILSSTRCDGDRLAIQLPEEGSRDLYSIDESVTRTHVSPDYSYFAARLGDETLIIYNLATDSAQSIDIQGLDQLSWLNEQRVVYSVRICEDISVHRSIARQLGLENTFTTQDCQIDLMTIDRDTLETTTLTSIHGYAVGSLNGTNDGSQLIFTLIDSILDEEGDYRLTAPTANIYRLDIESGALTIITEGTYSIVG